MDFSEYRLTRNPSPLRNSTRNANEIDERPPEYHSYHYDPLTKKPGAIRILKLSPSSYDNPQIDCEIITPKEDSEENLSAPKPYEALSWCWGTADKTKYIRITKGEETYAKYVAPNLFSALLALRHHQKFRYLWIDAICIDQDDLDEKNHQVEMMAEIYGNADRVCIWLGDATDSSEIALKFIKEEVLRLQNFDELCDSREASSKWHALLELMQRDWFSRRWVVQEIALARSALIYCGTDKISWNKFAVAVELFVEVETATHRLSEVMETDPEHYNVPGLFEYVSALGASLLVDATGKLFRDYKVEEQSEDYSLPKAEYGPYTNFEYSSDYETALPAGPDKDNNRMVGKKPRSDIQRDRNGQKSKGPPLLGLEYLVSSLSIFNTSVPHDTIYALLAIAKDTTPAAADVDMYQSSNHVQDVLEIFMQRKRFNVNYKLPYVDVCKEFIYFCVTQSLQIDRSRALDVICRPWATEEKDLEARRRVAERARRKREDEKRLNELLEARRSRGRKHTEKYQESYHDVPHEEFDAARSKDMPLPSWVPQLSSAAYAMYSQPGIAGIKMSRKNADPLVGLPSMTQRNYAAAETKSVDMKRLKFRKRHDLGHFSMYVKGFVLDTIKVVSQLSRNGQIPDEWAEIGGWPGADSDPPDAFWRTLVANRGKDEKNPPVYYARACKESFRKGGFTGGAVNTTALINYERNSVVAQFCRRVQAVTWNRALVRTKTDKLGLVGKNVQIDDLVCILYGCSVPVILRKSPQKGEETFKSEVEWELNFLTDTLRTYVKRWQKRVSELKQIKEKAKQRYFEWEAQKCREWLDTRRQKDPERVRDLKQMLDEESRAAQELDEKIKAARKLMEDAELAHKQEEAKAARKLKEAKAAHKLYEKVGDTRKREDEARVAQKLEDPDVTRKRYEEANAVFEKATQAALSRRLEETKNVRRLEQEAQDAQKKYEQAKAGQNLEDEAGVAQNLEDPDAARKRYEEANAVFEKATQAAVSRRLEEAKNVWKLEQEAQDAQKQYEQVKAGRNIEDESRVAQMLEKAKEARKSYEKARAARKYHLQLLNPDLKLGREFNAWKQDAIKPAKRKKHLPAVDWREFELWLKYGRYWKKKMRSRKKQLRERIEEKVTKKIESEWERHTKDKSRGRNGEVISRETHLQATISFRRNIKILTVGWTSGKDNASSPTTELSSETQNTSFKGQGVGVNESNGDVDAQNGLPNGGQSQSQRSTPETVDNQGKTNETTDEKISGLLDDDSDESEWENGAGKDATRKFYRELKKLEAKQREARNDSDSKRYEQLEKEKNALKDANWKLYIGQEKLKKEKSLKERLGEISIEKGRVRRRLTEKTAKIYDKKIRKNLRDKLGKDGFYYYQLLGECYIHGIMDGEAMEYQNGDDENAAIPETTFELR